MKVFVVKEAGFCFGVKRSMQLVEEALNKNKKIFLLGPLIHNPQVIRNLEERGAKVINSVEEASAGSTILIRAHGVPPEIYKKIKELNLDLIDATCPFVKMVQEKARELFESNYNVIIVGEKKHPEVIGILGNAPQAVVLEDFEQAENFVNDYVVKDKALNNDLTESLYLSRINKIGVVSQTTQTDENFSSIVKVLAANSRELKVFNTICNATHLRQTNTRNLSKKVDLMIVVGGKNSGNTKRLFELCKENCKTYWVETFAELKKEFFSGVNSVGITAGASTPNYIINEVVEWVKNLN